MKRLLFACTVALASSLVAFAACKQDEGERCQVDEDCIQPGLVCNQATGTCQRMGVGPQDAEVIDMVPADAAVDAMVDAMPDAP